MAKNSDNTQEKTASESAGTTETDEKDSTGKAQVPAETEASGDSSDAKKAPAGKKPRNTTLLIVELCIALVAVIVIIVAIVIGRRREKAENTGDVAADASSAAGDALSSGIDNSAVYEFAPTIPDVATLNALSLEECEAAVADGRMIKLTSPGGDAVYVSNYRDADYLASQLAVDDAAVEAYIRDEILATYTVPIAADHDTAQLGDVANIDYAGTKDGVAFEGGTYAGYDLELGSHSFIDGFEDGIVGMKVGETRELNLTFPEVYHSEELAGQDVIFTVTLNALNTMGYADALTDEVASYVSEGQYATAEAFRDFLAQEVLPYQNLNSFLFDDLYVSGISEDDIRAYYDESVEYYIENSAQYGMSLESMLLAYSDEGLETFLQESMDEAVETTRADRLYEAIVASELAIVTEADVTELAVEYGYEDDPSAFIDQYGMEYLMKYLTSQRAYEYIEGLAEAALGNTADNATE